MNNTKRLDKKQLKEILNLTGVTETLEKNEPITGFSGYITLEHPYFLEHLLRIKLTCVKVTDNQALYVYKNTSSNTNFELRINYTNKGDELFPDYTDFTACYTATY